MPLEDSCERLTMGSHGPLLQGDHLASAPLPGVRLRPPERCRRGLTRPLVPETMLSGFAPEGDAGSGVRSRCSDVQRRTASAGPGAVDHGLDRSKDAGAARRPSTHRQVQCLSWGTLAKTWSTCMPHPDHVTFWHTVHTAGLHIVILLCLLTTCSHYTPWGIVTVKESEE